MHTCVLGVVFYLLGLFRFVWNRVIDEEWLRACRPCGAWDLSSTSNSSLYFKVSFSIKHIA